MARGGGNKKRIQYCTDDSGEILYLRALQGHSGRNLVDPSLQDNVLIPDGFFKYIYHVGCAINVHSIINSGLIPGGQNLSKRQTVFFLLVDPIDKEHKDPETIDLGAPRLARYMHKAWKKHQNTVLLGRYQTCSKETIEVLSYTIERRHSLQNTSSLLYPESCSDGKWRKNFTKKSLNHLECLRRFSWDMIGWRNWFQKLLDKQKSNKQPNQTLQIMIERRDPLWQNKRPVRVLRKSIHVSLVTARIPICLLNV